MQHGSLEPSAWVQRWSALVPEGATVLDVACGSGRHVRWFAGRGARVTAIDRDAQALATLAGTAAEIIVADIEAAPWPLAGRSFDAVVVTNYHWRALLPQIVASVGAGGVLIYETFARGNETVGKPSNPDFLLVPGELLHATSGCAPSPTGTASSPGRRRASCSASPRCARPRRRRHRRATRCKRARLRPPAQLKSCDSGESE